ncbi:MAG: CDP-alcohol phosphatidyltransferase family protein, partial [Pseudorhodobacter sp.]|nr:CDP-alcohol phosphatidyltransferase family protein [Frankiaceae bacterium]
MAPARPWTASRSRPHPRYGSGVTHSEPGADRIWTIPNALSALRLLGVPLFLYWTLVTEQDGRAILLLIAAGISDYLDGKIARRLGQFSGLGQLLDPAADRLYILAT